MMIHEFALLLLSAASLIGVPIYIVLRNTMVRNQPKTESGYSYSRVVSLTMTNIALISVTYLFFQLMLFGVLRFTFPSDPVLVILSLVFLLTTGLTCYGSGIYIMSIVLEAFTLPHLRTITAFKTQFIATHLFHGPISHFLIYSGFICALFTLALLEFFSPTPFPRNVFVVLLSLPVGVMYAIAQIYNKTYPYQLITSLFTGASFLFLTGILFSDIEIGTMGMYFLLFSFSLSTVLTGYFLYREFLRHRPKKG